MQFLKTLFWVIVAVVLVLFANQNWNAATINLWGGLQADVKIPVLVIAAFLLGFLPTWAVYKTRIWSLRRRLEAQTTPHVNVPANLPTGPAATPIRTSPDEEERIATDSKIWPTA